MDNKSIVDSIVPEIPVVGLIYEGYQIYTQYENLDKAFDQHILDSSKPLIA